MKLLFSNRPWLSKAFIDKVISISDKLAIDPNWLMFLMDWESGISSTRENSFGCLGLIQFCPDIPGGIYKTINGLRYELQAIKSMAPEDQLDIVYEYLREIQNEKGKFADYHQLYFAILFPEAYGQPNEYMLATKSNPVFDLNKNGQVTVGEVKSYLDTRVREKVNAEYWNIFFKKKTFCSSIKEKSSCGELLLQD